MDIENYDVPDNTKVATVRPIYKKKSQKYLPISLLNAFSKTYERCIHNSITSFVNNFLSIFILANNSNHVLIRLIKNWKQSLDNQKLVGAVLIDALSCLRQFLATESPLKIMKNAFYFTLKDLFVLRIFKFLS